MNKVLLVAARDAYVRQVGVDRFQDTMVAVRL